MFIGSLDFYEFFGDHLHTGVQVTRLGEKLWNLSNPKYIVRNKKERKTVGLYKQNKYKEWQSRERGEEMGGWHVCV
jgi:hypothetical protein